MYTTLHQIILYAFEIFSWKKIWRVIRTFDEKRKYEKFQYQSHRNKKDQKDKKKIKKKVNVSV